jgi:hypothetical protein
MKPIPPGMLKLYVVIDRGMRHRAAFHEIRGLEDQERGTAPKRKVSSVRTDGDRRDDQQEWRSRNLEAYLMTGMSQRHYNDGQVFGISYCVSRE